MSPDSPVRAALLDAFARLRPELGELADRLAGQLPEAEREHVDPAETEQFLNAFEALVIEALRGEGRETRDFIFDTAIPAMVAQGQRPLDLLESHITFFVVLSHRLCTDVGPGLADDAAVWLGTFFAGYGREVTERALAAEAAGQQ